MGGRTFQTVSPCIVLPGYRAHRLPDHAVRGHRLREVPNAAVVSTRVDKHDATGSGNPDPDPDPRKATGEYMRHLVLGFHQFSPSLNR